MVMAATAAVAAASSGGARARFPSQRSVAEVREVSCRSDSAASQTENEEESEEYDIDISISPSRSDFQRPDRRRFSTGFVYNPGNKTVDVMQGARSARPFSVGHDGALMRLRRTLPAPYTITEEALESARTHEQEIVTARSARHSFAGSPREVARLSQVGSGLFESAPPSSAGSAGIPSPRLSLVPGSGAWLLAQKTPGEIFSQFLVAGSAEAAREAFDALCSQCDAGNVKEQPYRRLQQLLGTQGPWKARSVWSLLEARAKLPEYQAAPLSRTRVVVGGAGPCGLRAACELALLQANVVVVEKRPPSQAFGRINLVHLWEWCKQDIIGWGAKVFDPPGGSFGGDNDFCHIGIGELQLLLYKNALLLGVKVLFCLEAREVDESTSEGVCREPHVSARDPLRLPCDALVIVSGASTALARSLGFRSVTLGLRGKSSAIGVVANFKNTRDPREVALRQFSWAKQFNQPLFREVEKVTSVNLENVVYYKAQAHHYMVMTPTKKCLEELGVIKDGRSGSSMLASSNVDVQQLTSMVQRIGKFFGLPTQELCESQGAMIFDFSGVRRLENSAIITSGGLFACAVGDALLEPFWPEGLGIVRGFFSALDAAAAIVLATSGQKQEAVAQMTATYNILKSVAAQSAGQCLQKDHRLYRLQPSTRYMLKS